VNGWLELARQWAAEQVDRLAASGNAAVADGLIAVGLVLCLLVALLVRSRAPAPEPLGAPAVLPESAAPAEAGDDGAARAAVTAVVETLAAAHEHPARAARLEDHGGHLTRMVQTLLGLGASEEAVLAALGHGDTGPALSLLAANARARGEARDPAAAAAFCDLAALALLDDPAAAVAAVRHAAVLAPDRPEIWSLWALAAAEAGDLADARSAAETVLTSGAGDVDQGMRAGALGILGEIYLAEGNLDRAEEYFRIALAYQAGLARPGGMVRHYRKLCQLHERRGDLAGAADLLSRALVLETQVGRGGGVAELEKEAGDLARRSGRLPDACRHWARARLLFQELGQQDRAAGIDGLIAAAIRRPTRQPRPP